MSWSVIDVAKILGAIEAGDIVGPVPSLMPRTDGPSLVYPGELHALSGEPESGKGWIVLSEASRLLAADQEVLYLDFEDTPANVFSRLLALGTPPASMIARLSYVSPETEPGEYGLPRLREDGPYALVILDGMTEAYGLLGLSYDDNKDVPRFRRTLARPFLDQGAAVIEIDHVTKSKEGRGRYAIGGQHKLAGAAVAYGVEVIEAPSRAKAGKVKVRVHKDRHGHVRGHADPHGVIALVTITPTAGGERVTVSIDPPDSTTRTGEFRPTVLMERVSKYVEANPNASIRSIRESVPGKATGVDQAITVLVSEGWIERSAKGQAHLHKSITAYREEADDTNRVPVSQPCPTVSPDTGATNRVPVSPPYKGDTVRDTHRSALTADLFDDDGDTV